MTGHHSVCGGVHEPGYEVPQVGASQPALTNAPTHVGITPTSISFDGVTIGTVIENSPRRQGAREMVMPIPVQINAPHEMHLNPAFVNYYQDAQAEQHQRILMDVAVREEMRALTESYITSGLGAGMPEFTLESWLARPIQDLRESALRLHALRIIEQMLLGHGALNCKFKTTINMNWGSFVGCRATLRGISMGIISRVDVNIVDDVYEYTVYLRRDTPVPQFTPSIEWNTGNSWDTCSFSNTTVGHQRLTEEESVMNAGRATDQRIIEAQRAHPEIDFSEETDARQDVLNGRFRP